MSKKLLLSAIITLLFCMVAEQSVYAETYPISYGGRLTKAGIPVEGPVDLEITFYREGEGGDPLILPLIESNVQLNQGVFQLDISLSAGDLATLFGNGSLAVFIQVADMTNELLYPRQKFNSVPLALRVPINTATLEYDANGKLNLKTAPASAFNDLSDVDTTGAAANKILKYDGANWIVADDLTGGVGTITTSDLQDLTILNEDISASAGIDPAKLGQVAATSGQVLA